jgi:Polysaccharide lyase
MSRLTTPLLAAAALALVALPWTVACEPASAAVSVTGLQLVDADTGEPIRPLTDGAKLDLGKLPPHLNVLAQTSSSVSAVLFELDGGLLAFRDQSPFLLAAAGYSGFQQPWWSPAPGGHQLAVRPVGGGTTLSVAFTVTGSPPFGAAPGPPPPPPPPPGGDGGGAGGGGSGGGDAGGGGDPGGGGSAGGGSDSPGDPGPPPPPPPPPPGGGALVFNGDFETGSLSGWSAVQRIAPDRITVVTTGARQGRYAARFEIDGGDGKVATGQRAELLWGGDNHPTLSPGDDYYFGWSTRFATDFPSPTNGGHCIFAQFKSTGTGGSPVDMHCRNDRIQIGYDGDCGGWSTPLIRGGWNDFVAHIHFSSDPSAGFLELWHRAPNEVVLTRKINHCMIQTLRPGRSGYLKLGYYRRNDEMRTGVMWEDGMRVGTSFGAVAPALAAIPGYSAPPTTGSM